jgi:hypothetical protein
LPSRGERASPSLSPAGLGEPQPAARPPGPDRDAPVELATLRRRELRPRRSSLLASLLPFWFVLFFPLPLLRFRAPRVRR